MNNTVLCCIKNSCLSLILSTFIDNTMRVNRAGSCLCWRCFQTSSCPEITDRGIFVDSQDKGLLIGAIIAPVANFSNLFFTHLSSQYVRFYLPYLSAKSLVKKF